MSDSTADIYSLLGQLQQRQQELLAKLGDKCPGSKAVNNDEAEYSALVQKIFIIKMELLKRKAPRPTV